MSKKVGFHYDTILDLWTAYLQDETGNRDDFVRYALSEFGQMTERDAVIIWQSFDMIYVKSREEYDREDIKE